MADLRDKGYPSAKEYIPNKSSKNNLLMTDQINPALVRTPYWQDTEWVPSAAEQALDKLRVAYNNRAMGNGKAPLISKNDLDYVDDATDSRGHTTLWRADYLNGDRKGFFSRDVNGGRTYYGAGIDIYNPKLQDVSFNKTFETPLGTLDAGFEDGTLYGDFTAPKDKYYIAALRQLLGRLNLSHGNGESL